MLAELYEPMRPRASRRFSFRCEHDGCIAETRPYATPMIAAEMARFDGWRIDAAGADLCPMHAETTEGEESL